MTAAGTTRNGNVGSISGAIIIARYGEVHLKGGNRAMFLNALTRNLRARLGEMGAVALRDGRYIIDNFDPKNTDEILQITANTFGITSASPVTVISHAEILKHMGQIRLGSADGDAGVGGRSTTSFRVNVNRADKKFPHTSMEFAAICGGAILDANPNARVDLHNPDIIINADIRENDRAFIYDRVIAGVGGMPYGTAGRALLCISGGIDSPVAGWLSAKRGLAIDCVHFSSPPYTSAKAFDKVKRICAQMENYCGKINLVEINFTDIMQEIKKKCHPAYTITIMRREMMRVCAEMCRTHRYDCIVTGENLGQVASQTIAGITTTNAAAGDVPILRPLIMYDKNEIVALARRIGTYDISIEPHEDCCSVFVPDSPVINPTINFCEKEELKLDKYKKA